MYTVGTSKNFAVKFEHLIECVVIQEYKLLKIVHSSALIVILSRVFHRKNFVRYNTFWDFLGVVAVSWIRRCREKDHISTSAGLIVTVTEYLFLVISFRLELSRF